MNRRGPGCGCFGCGGTVLVTVLVLGALAWFFVLKPAREFVANWQTPPAQTQTRTTPAPTGNVNQPVTRADVERFVRVRRDVRAALGQSFTGLQGLLNDLNSGQTPNLVRVLDVLKQTGQSVGQARTAQARALTREGMSLERYAVVRDNVNRALGLPNVDFGKVAQSIQNGQLPDLNRNVQTATSQEKALVKGFEAELKATAAAGLLGL